MVAMEEIQRGVGYDDRMRHQDWMWEDVRFGAKTVLLHLRRGRVCT